MRGHSSAAGTGSPLDTVCGWAVSGGTIVFLLTAGWLLYGTLFQTHSFYGVNPLTQRIVPDEQYLDVLIRIQLVLRIMALAGVLITLGALGRYWSYHETGVLLGVLGGAIFFAAPYLFDSTSAALPQNARIRALEIVGHYTHILGAVILAAAGIHLLIHSITVFRYMRQRRPGVRTDISGAAFAGRQVAEKRDRFFGPCWELPFCRDTVKKICPIRHSRQPCWRKGHGCYCDNEIVLLLSGERSTGQRRTAAGFVNPQDLTKRRPLDSRTKRHQCLGCPIYLHHQEQKYRVLAPLVALGVIALLAASKPQIDAIYPQAMRALGRALGSFSYSATPQSGVPDWAEELAQTAGVEWLLIIVGTLLLLSYIIHAVEWTLYKWGI